MRLAMRRQRNIVKVAMARRLGLRLNVAEGLGVFIPRNRALGWCWRKQNSADFPERNLRTPRANKLKNNCSYRRLRLRQSVGSVVFTSRTKTNYPHKCERVFRFHYGRPSFVRNPCCLDTSTIGGI
jgi:hypothetical protein